MPYLFRAGPSLLLTAAFLVTPAFAVEHLLLPSPDVAAVLAADEARPLPRPYRFAVAIPVRVSPATHGVWQVDPNGLLRWRLEVSAPGARSLNFGFTRAQLPPGARLHLSSADGRQGHGPYRAANLTQGQLWTPLIQNERAMIELTLPAEQRAGLRLELAQVSYGFRGFEDEPKLRESCHIDVACPEGEEWRNESRSVARIITAGTFVCTGQLLNNTARDFRAYFLTAAHCMPTGVEAAATVFYWNYENSACGGARDGNDTQTQTGAMLRASSLNVPSNTHPDFLLLELSQKPPASYRVYYSGWDKRDLAPVGVVGIHHPAGEEKRISVDDDPTLFDDSVSLDNEPVIAPQYLVVEGWDHGSTEQGSSGSGLWNLEHRLVGTLTSEDGNASCGREENNYSRFNRAWYGVSSTTTSVASHLDPLNSGVEVLDGADPNGLELRPKSSANSRLGIAGALPLALLVVLAILSGLRRRN